MNGPETPPAVIETPVAAATIDPGPAVNDSAPIPLQLDEGPPREKSRPAEATASNPAPAQRDLSAFRLILTVGVVFISLFLFVRTFAVEPFGVPTGSMAPSLIGNHREAPCPRCGYPVRVGFPSQGGNAEEQFSHVGCPSCGKPFSLAEARDLSGDRLLVDKNVFNLRPPRRWEMAVFHCPDPDPKELGKPYVKRVIGLPGETIRIIDGEVYADDQLLRKTLAEVRETRLVVFDMSYVPKPGDWNVRWLLEPPENDPRLPESTSRPLEVADSHVVHEGVLTLDASEPARPNAGVRYRHWNLDEHKEELVRAWSSYDGYPRAMHHLPAVHDFSLSCDIEVVSAGADGLFECSLSDGADTILADLTVGPRASGLATMTQHGQGGLGSVRGIGLEPGRTYRFEFSFVDRRAILALDGRLVLPPVDLPQLHKRGDVRNPVQLRARGCSLVIRNFILYRDIYYTQFGEHGTQHPAELGPQEFFVLGDNSSNSQDSRKWPSPGVPEADFIGKPFLIHQPLRTARIAIGGRERVFQTLDWSRLRWLH